MHTKVRQKISVAVLLAAAAVAPRAEVADGKQTLEAGGLTRSYVVRAPAMQRGNPRVPLVLVLHGGGGNAANAEQMTGFTQKARSEGFIVVYPEGTGRRRNALLTWNADHCCGYAMTNNVDDVAFIGALIDKLTQSYAIDANRIYVTGMSNGGMMTHRLGRELSQRIAAIAPVVAAVFGDEEQPVHPVSALIINGMLDKSVPLTGGRSGGRGSNAWDGMPMLPTEKQAEFWSKANDCSVEPEKSETSSIVRSRYRCPSGRSVELLIVKDNGHAWPGGTSGSRRGDKPSVALNATNLIWDFFKARTLEPRTSTTSNPL